MKYAFGFVLMVQIVGWSLLYRNRKKSKELGILEEADKRFNEPIVNLLVLSGIFMIIALLEWKFDV